MTKIVRASRSSGVKATSGDGSFLAGDSRPNRPPPPLPIPNLGGERLLPPRRSRDLDLDRRCDRFSLLLLRRCLSLLRLRRRSPLRLRFLSRLRLLLRSLSRRCLRSLDLDLERRRSLSLALLGDRLLKSKMNWKSRIFR